VTKKMKDLADAGDPPKRLYVRQWAEFQDKQWEDDMNDKYEVLDKRVRRLESQNRRLKWIGMVLVVLTMTSAVWAQKSGNEAMQAQKFQLRDEAGRLRAELSMSNGDPTLRFFGEHEVAESVIDGYSFTIFKKGGSEANILASFDSDGLAFEDGKDRQFVVLRADQESQTGELHLNDYRHKAYAAVTATELSKLRAEKAR